MNVLDRLIAVFSPALGVRRWQARQAMEHIRAYEGAKRGRRTASWDAKGSSANAENLPALSTLRNRSSDLVRNNPWAKKAIGNWVDDAIGTGIRLALPADSPAAKSWNAFAETTACDADGLSDFYGLQALAARTMWERGAVIIRRRWRRPADGLLIPVQLQVLEPDYLDESKTEETKTGLIIGGVEFDKLGRRIAYWLYDQHPGEAYGRGLILQSRRVPAEDVIYAFKRMRAGQIHGVPELAPVLLRMRDLDDYEDAELTRKKVEACFTAFVSQGDMPGSTLGAAVDDGKPRPVERVSPGMIKYLRPGEEVSFAQPTAVAGYSEYMRVGHRAIAAGVSQTYEQLSGDLSQVNYSSARAGMLPYRRGVEAWQWLTFVPMVCQRVVAWFNEAAMLAGQPEVPAGIDWTTPRFEWVDPVKDMKGELLKVAAGVQSFSELARRLGTQPDKVLAELKKDWERITSLGIPISLDGLIALATAQDEQPSKEDKPS